MHLRVIRSRIMKKSHYYVINQISLEEARYAGVRIISRSIAM